MEMLNHLLRLFSYDHWANREVIASFRTAASPPARSVKLLAHVLGTEYTWFSRLVQEKPQLPVWPELTIAQCEEHIEKLNQTWCKYLAATRPPGLAATVAYKNSKGESWDSSVEDILLHVVIHSAYHRGQIAADMRAAGFTPAYTDFIHGVRQKLVE
jgi:uncharacterized damage-inducible protein DinB